jgi:hypothetical protein
MAATYFRNFNYAEILNARNRFKAPICHPEAFNFVIGRSNRPAITALAYTSARSADLFSKSWRFSTPSAYVK